MREGNVLTRVCVSAHTEGGYPGHVPVLDGGGVYPHPSWQGDTLIPGEEGECPHLADGGLPHPRSE